MSLSPQLRCVTWRGTRATALLIAALLGAVAPDIRAQENPPPPPAVPALKTSIEFPDAWNPITKVLPEFVSDNIPASEVARILRKQFNEAFDVLLPNPSPDPTKPGNAALDPATGLPVPSPQMEIVDWQQTTIALQLKNVKAWDVFNAMNIKFQLNKEPLRWDLIVNGDRPTAVLRVVDPAELRPMAPPPPSDERRAVIYAGELLSKNTPGGMSLRDVCRALVEVDEQARGGQPQPVISTYEPGDLLIVRGTPEQLEFVRSTLSALQHKVVMDERLKAKVISERQSANPMTMSPEMMKRYGLDKAARPAGSNAPSAEPAPGQ